jgi:hypothetical protein
MRQRIVGAVAQQRGARRVDAGMLRRIWRFAVLLSLGAAASAAAATVEYESTPLGHGEGQAVALRAIGGPGDDDLTATTVAGAVVIRDGAGPLSGTDACSEESSQIWRCPLSVSVTLRGAAGDDRLSAGAGTLGGVTLDGGEGDDLLTGGPSHDHFLGGPGRDRIVGGGGGDEALIDATAGLEGDDIDFRPGGGHISVKAGTAPLTMDLAAGTLTDGRAVDTVAAVTDADITGPGVAKLLGTDGPDMLAAPGLVDGRGGNDRIFGQAGHNVLRGGAGADEITVAPGSDVDAGPGDDVLRPASSLIRPSSTAKIVCGPGDDQLSPIGAVPTPLDCERTLLDSGIALGTPTASRRTISIRMTAPKGYCGVVATARTVSGRAVTARTQARVDRGAAGVTVRMRRLHGDRVGMVRVVVGLSSSCRTGDHWKTFLTATPRMLVRWPTP